MPLNESLEDDGRSIGTAIVHDDQLNIRIILSKKSGYAFLDVSFLVAGGEDDGYAWGGLRRTGVAFGMKHDSAAQGELDCNGASEPNEADEPGQSDPSLKTNGQVTTYPLWTPRTGIGGL